MSHARSHSQYSVRREQCAVLSSTTKLRKNLTYLSHSRTPDTTGVITPNGRAAYQPAE